jgi:hypothetical protein
MISTEIEHVRVRIILEYVLYLLLLSLNDFPNRRSAIPSRYAIAIYIL